MAESKVLLDIRDGVAVLTLNRPQSRNALDAGLIEELLGHLRRLALGEDARACVLTGAGSSFCAGADLKQRLGMTAEEQSAHAESIFRCANLLEQLPIPVIAAVNGPAYAGGLELAIACDVRLAAAGATFAFPEVNLGIFPGAGGPIRLPRLVGQGQARLMIFGGQPVGAEEALRIGLVERVVPAAKLMEEGVGLAARIAQGSGAGVRAAKALMNAVGEMSFDAAAAFSNALRRPLSGTAEARSGLERFDREGRISPTKSLGRP